MKRTVRSFAALAGLGLFGVVACTTEETVADLGDRCSLNSECKDPLVCGFERCRPECATSRDCGGRRCMRTAAGANVCQLEDEVSCTHNSQCPGTQVCAADLQCRDQCVSDKDCVGGQQCTDSVCAETTELGPGGVLPARVPTEGVRCTYATECPGDLVCLNGVCAIECYNDRDCYVTWQCNTVALGGDGRCYPPGKVPPTDGGAGDGGPTDGGSDGGPSDGGDGGVRLPVAELALGPGCAILEDGRAKCWDYSQPILSAQVQNAPPEIVPGLQDVRQIIGTQQRRVALLGDGSVWTFGPNVRNPLMAYQWEPTRVELPNAISLADGLNRTVLVFLEDDQTIIWNPSDDSQVYDESNLEYAFGLQHAYIKNRETRVIEIGPRGSWDSKLFEQVFDAAVVARIETNTDGNRESACAIVRQFGDGEESWNDLVCWGGGVPTDGGFEGEVSLGGEPMEDQPDPTSAGIPDPEHIVASRIRVAVLNKDGEVWSWCPRYLESCSNTWPHREQIGDGGEFHASKLASMGPLGAEEYFDATLEPLCAINLDGDLYCARYDNQFERVEGVANVVDAMVTMGRVYIVTAAGELKVWHTTDWWDPEAAILEDIPL